MQKKYMFVLRSTELYEAESEKYPLPCPTPTTNILSKALYTDSLIEQLLNTTITTFTVMSENTSDSSHLYSCRSGQINVKM